MKEGTHLMKWICNSCKNKVIAEEKPTGFKWTDGHECHYTEVLS